MSDTPTIATRDLAKHFGDVAALRGVTFDVREGEVFGYLGRNGSGKTTTVRILTTLTRPTSGTAAVAGIDISRPHEVRQRIGVTLQEAALDPTMTGGDHLRLIAGLWGMRRDAVATRANELLELFGLVDAADRRIATYSGGMQRRLDIATALIARPRVLFLDEPTTGLDVQSRRALWSEIRGLRDNGVTVFLTTQYLEEADELADRIAIIDEGRIVADGTTAELKSTHGRTTIDIAHEGTLDSVAAALNGTALVAVSAASPQRATITVDTANGGEGVLSVLARLRDHGPAIGRLSVSETSLEDVFLRLTGSSIVVSSDEVTELEPA
jgi:ABC-2 type transport system ATP-binding protein